MLLDIAHRHANTSGAHSKSDTLCKKPVTTMLTHPWKCTVLHCNHLGNTWKPLVLMTRHFDYCPSASMLIMWYNTICTIIIKESHAQCLSLCSNQKGTICLLCKCCNNHKRIICSIFKYYSNHKGILCPLCVTVITQEQAVPYVRVTVIIKESYACYVSNTIFIKE